MAKIGMENGEMTKFWEDGENRDGKWENYKVLGRWRKLGRKMGKLQSFGKMAKIGTENGKITKLWEDGKNRDGKWENDNVLGRWRKLGWKMGK
jgi:hypothetical protein